MNLVKEEKLELENTMYLGETPRFKTDELKYLEKNIFNNRAKKYDKKWKISNYF